MRRAIADTNSDDIWVFCDGCGKQARIRQYGAYGMYSEPRCQCSADRGRLVYMSRAGMGRFPEDAPRSYHPRGGSLWFS